ncbi:glutathione S-transferase 1-1 [Rhipicephalus sanguineus]|uniref:glutathione S-transferase 1-1 n=1 Tax=Rhipicephalus sanguineus TaxID=34632 RepID=UPI0018932562|nr:glutathione S-transferase 1-1 [Rhipicephalus sanguineus]
MPVLLYNLVGSPPCGFIRCLAKEIGVQLSLKDLDFGKGEHRSAEFLKINPFHKVPAIDDSGFIVYESNAIAYYLLRKYAPESQLYPNCIKTRTRIDQVLAAVNGNINPSLGAFLRPLCLQSTKHGADELKACEENVVKTLERLVGESKFAAGDKITIADLCLIGHVIFCLEIPCVNKAKYPKLTAYYDRVKSALPYFDEIYGPVLTLIKKLWDRMK